MAKKETETIDINIADLKTDRENVFIGAMVNTNILRDLSMQMFDLTESANITREEAASKVARIYSDVCAEVYEDTGKPAYGNDGARKAEALSRESEDVTLITLHTQLRAQLRDIAVLQARIESIRGYINISRDYLRGFGN